MSTGIPEDDVLQATPAASSRFEVFVVRVFLLSLAIGGISGSLYCGWFLATTNLCDCSVDHSEEVFFWAC